MHPMTLYDGCYLIYVGNIVKPVSIKIFTKVNLMSCLHFKDERIASEICSIASIYPFAINSNSTLRTSIVVELRFRLITYHAFAKIPSSYILTNASLI